MSGIGVSPITKFTNASVDGNKINVTVQIGNETIQGIVTKTIIGTNGI
jgi:hypothetical protein